MWKITIANFAVDPASDLALRRGENIFDPRKQIKTNKKKGTLRNRKHADSDSVVIEFMREVEKDFQQSRLKAEYEDDTDPPKVFISLVKRSNNDESSTASHPGSRVRVDVPNISMDPLRHREVVRLWRRRIRDGDILTVDYEAARPCLSCGLLVFNAIDMFRHIRDLHVPNDIPKCKKEEL